jgi:type IV pilus biogenesis protein CpaD/CtpE
MPNNLRKKLLLPFAVVLSLAACKQEPPATSVSQPQAVQTPVKIDFNQIKIKSSISPEEVVLFDNGQQRTMQYLTPQMRTAAGLFSSC